MKRKLTSTVLAIALMFSLSVPAFAADCQTTSRSACPSTALLQILLQYGCGTSNSGKTNVQFDLNELLNQLAQAAKNGNTAAQPTTPSQSGTPSKPEAETPAKPAEPSKPVETGTPAKPAEPSKPAETETSAQPTTSANSDFMSAYEQEVVRLVNVERAKAGLAPLTADAQLTRTARMKSQDMHDKRYFDHTSPTYGSPFDLMKSQGVKYRTAGENIAVGYATPQAVVNAWMNSPGHRANILNSSYTKIGVGYVSSGSYWTQHFTG